MPRLTAVELTYGPSIEVRFTTTIPLADACDTAVLQVVDSARSGSEVGIRIERGLISDLYLWDAGRLMRQALSLQEAVISGTCVSFVIPTELAPIVQGTPRLEAALIINGAPVQSRFPVRLAPRHVRSETRHAAASARS